MADLTVAKTLKVKGSVDNVYCDQLLSTFENATGIYGRL